jgi:SAM-dependent methyltransferase
MEAATASILKVTNTRGSAVPPEFQDYILRAINLYDRSPDLRARFASADNPAFAKFIDTEAILYTRELQEVGVPFPASQEMLTVGGETDLRLFLSIGYSCFESVLKRIPETMARPINLLDFGVGCARTMRFFFREPHRFRCHGCDVDRRAIAYLIEDVPFIIAEQTGNHPPLPYPSSHFDVVYSISVFTHLAQNAFKLWLQEIHRVLKPDGLLMVTLHGDTAFNAVSSDPERRRLIGIRDQEFELGKFRFAKNGFTWMNQPAGSPDIDSSQFGICFISRRSLDSWILPGFKLLEYADGEIGGWQDLAILKRIPGGLRIS